MEDGLPGPSTVISRETVLMDLMKQNAVSRTNYHYSVVSSVHTTRRRQCICVAANASVIGCAFEMLTNYESGSIDVPCGRRGIRCIVYLHNLFLL